MPKKEKQKPTAAPPLTKAEWRSLAARLRAVAAELDAAIKASR
jgi:hypothetical protein